MQRRNFIGVMLGVSIAARTKKAAAEIEECSKIAEPKMYEVDSSKISLENLFRRGLRRDSRKAPLKILVVDPFQVNMEDILKANFRNTGVYVIRIRRAFWGKGKAIYWLDPEDMRSMRGIAEELEEQTHEKNDPDDRQGNDTHPGWNPKYRGTPCNRSYYRYPSLSELDAKYMQYLTRIGHAHVRAEKGTRK